MISLRMNRCYRQFRLQEIYAGTEIYKVQWMGHYVPYFKGHKYIIDSNEKLIHQWSVDVEAPIVGTSVSEESRIEWLLQYKNAPYMEEIFAPQSGYVDGCNFFADYASEFIKHENLDIQEDFSYTDLDNGFFSERMISYFSSDSFEKHYSSFCYSDHVLSFSQLHGDTLRNYRVFPISYINRFC